MNAVEVPQAVDDLRAKLVDLGFRAGSEQRGGMGGLEQIFASEVSGVRVYVRITADRGHWIIQLRVDPMSAWIIPSVWIAYLDKREVKELSIDDQASFVSERIGEVVTLVTTIAGLEGRLIRLGEDYMRRRLTS